MTTEIRDVLERRQETYGEFQDHAAIAQYIKAVYRTRCRAGWTNLGCDKREALDMIAHKIARILNGEPGHADSWLDIAGYATLVHDKLEADNADVDTTPDHR